MQIESKIRSGHDQNLKSVLRMAISGTVSHSFSLVSPGGLKFARSATLSASITPRRVLPFHVVRRVTSFFDRRQWE